MGGGASHADFQRAAEEFAAHPNSSGPITEMMRLACEGTSSQLRKWAAKWLKAKCNILVVTDTEQGQDNAATPQAANLR